MNTALIRKHHIYELLLETSEGYYISKAQIKTSLQNLESKNKNNPLYVGIGSLATKTIERNVVTIAEFYNLNIKHKKNYGYYIFKENLKNEAYRKVFDKVELLVISQKEKEWSPHITVEESSLNTSINILGLVKAIKRKLWITITYKGWFDDLTDDIQKAKVQPLHIKQVNRGWYLLVYNETIGVKTLCLDTRVTSLIITTELIENPLKFDISEYFKNSIGILNNEIKPERIVLKVVSHHLKYLKSKPLHWTQEIIEEPKETDANELDYANENIWGTLVVTLQPNYEFLMEIFRYNAWVYVVEPKWLADKIASHYRFILNTYYPNTDTTITFPK